MIEIKKNHSFEKELIWKESEAKANQIEKKHVYETEGLKREVTKYSAALLIRDDFGQKVMSDNDINSRLFDLVGDIDDLARLEWKSNQTRWSAQVLKFGSAEGERMLKKHILKDGIWKMH